MYRIEFTKQALKNLERISKVHAKNILYKIENLAKEPDKKNNNTKLLKGYEEKVYRLRVGDYRVIYEIFDTKLVIKVINVQPRGSVYND